MNGSEQIIRSEMQSLRSVGFNLCQTGVAICVAVEIILVFIRRHSYERLAGANEGAYVPWGRFLLGTLFLAIIASIFTGLVLFVRDRYAFYNNLLRGQSEGSVPVPPPGKVGVLGVAAIFFAFPVADLLLRALFSSFANIR